MVGIRACAGYIPAFRIDRKTIAAPWGRASLGGERSVANNDEDSITMAVESARIGLEGLGGASVDGLYFATTTAPYVEKMNSALIAAALDLKRETLTVDFAHSLRAGVGALRAALDAVKGGSLANVLVTAADCRVGYPRSDQEQGFGDAAATVLVSHEDLVATYEGSYTVFHEMMDVWRNPEDTFVKTWESRFILGEGYTNHMVEVVKGIMKKHDLQATDIAKVIFPAPDTRTHGALLKQLGFKAETQAQDPLLSSVGFSGAAHPILMLTHALESAKPGDLILMAAYADGADALLFRTTDHVNRETGRRKVKDQLGQKIMLNSYARFLSYKGLVEAVPGEPFRLLPSATVTWRDRNSIMRCHASRCRKCGLLAFPVQRVCYGCNAKDDFDEESISHLEGEVFTFTRDNLAGRSDDPVVVQTVAELGKDKVRFYGMMTDCEPSEVQVGMQVGLTFRRIYEGAGMHNYFWKCRPAWNRRSE